MRIDRLNVRNFKGFSQREFKFHPKFNLIVGTNGTGKTSALDALAVAVGSWFLGVRGADSRHIRPSEVLLGSFIHDAQDDRVATHSLEYVYPCEVTAYGEVQGEQISWTRSLSSESSRTTYVHAQKIKRIASRSDSAIRSGESILLPLISYYGTGRLWQEPRESFKVTEPSNGMDKSELSRLAGYKNSVDPRLSVSQFSEWVVKQSWISFQQGGRVSPLFAAVKRAVVSCVEGALDFYYDAQLSEVVIEFSSFKRPFSLLSDGQRCMMAMIGDIAQKAAKLNPQLGERVLDDTPGVVLIDELDLHLHPLWQRRVVEDLRTTFKSIQFICSTHSPFLIQSLRSGEELLMLDGQPTADLANMSIGTIAQGIQGVENTDVSLRYNEMQKAAEWYLETLDESQDCEGERLQEIKKQLSDELSKYADNPAFQAFLEMKRVVKLGS